MILDTCGGSLANWTGQRNTFFIDFDDFDDFQAKAEKLWLRNGAALVAPGGRDPLSIGAEGTCSRDLPSVLERSPRQVETYRNECALTSILDQQ
jgi:hypothetical protein